MATTIKTWKIELTPMAKPRMTQADKWKKRPVVLRWRAYKDELRFVHKVNLDGFIDLEIIYCIPMPKSWTKKKKDLHRNRLHQQVPDCDNLTKAILDAGCTKSDAHIAIINESKYWTDTGCIYIKARAYDPFSKAREFYEPSEYTK